MTDDPLDAYWQTTHSIKNTNWTIKGYSRAADRTGFYIPELGVMFDAGPQLRIRPNHIFITHTHGDHVAQLPFTIIKASEDQPMVNLYAPRISESFLFEYISALISVNSCRPLAPDESGADADYIFYPMDAHADFELTIRNNPYKIEVFKCQHSIPTVSYGLSIIRPKLKDEYAMLNGRDIAILRKSGVEITRMLVVPVIAYVCDSSIEVLKWNPNILNYPTVMIECTFLTAEDSNESDHISWPELQPYVLAHPEIEFILFHFSRKYKKQELFDFFETINLPNIKPWI